MTIKVTELNLQMRRDGLRMRRETERQVMRRLSDRSGKGETDENKERKTDEEGHGDR